MKNNGNLFVGRNELLVHNGVIGAQVGCVVGASAEAGICVSGVAAGTAAGMTLGGSVVAFATGPV